MSALAAVLTVLLLQEGEALEREVARLAERLAGESVEGREQAARELAALGAKALPEMRRRAETGDAEVRERILAVVREIERLERLRFFLGGERRVSLKAERRPLGAILADLATQNPTPVELKEVSAEDPVTVEFRDATFFDALHRICLAHGGIVLQLPRGTHALEDHAPVELSKGDPRAARPFVEGPFVVAVESLYTVGSTDFRGGGKTSATLNIHVGWERGTRPVGMKLEVTSVVDEQGNAYQPKNLPETSMDVFIWRRRWVNLDRAPAPSISAFKEIAGTVEFTFPSDGHVARLDQPLGKRGVDVSGGPASFTLRDLVREKGGIVHAMLDAGWEARGPAQLHKFFLLDGQGRIHSPQGARGSGDGSGRMTWSLPFEVPEDAEIRELRAVKLSMEKGCMPTRKIAWKLENVRFR